MKTKPRHFALTENGYDALDSLEKHLPFFKRGKLVSLAIQIMELDRWGGQPITPAIHALAHERGIMLDSVIERLAAPDSASIPIRTRLSARSHKTTIARNLIDPILDVQTDWRWQKLKITLDPTGSSENDELGSKEN
jgi:hypothetical protein